MGSSAEDSPVPLEVQKAVIVVKTTRWVFVFGGLKDIILLLLLLLLYIYVCAYM